MPRSIATLMAAASPKSKRRVGLVPRHDIEGISADPVSQAAEAVGHIVART
jgi:hypothetical protein